MPRRARAISSLTWPERPAAKRTGCAQLMEDQGRILSVDIAPGRLKLVRENAARLGISILQTRAGDARELESDLAGADVVLLDAPCLGTGTLRRRPDAKWRKTPAALAELVALQRELLDAAATLVKPGGALVYSTCSLEPEENAQQARAFTERNGWPIEAAPAWDEGDSNARRLDSNLAATTGLRWDVRGEVAAPRLDIERTYDAQAGAVHGVQINLRGANVFVAQ